MGGSDQSIVLDKRRGAISCEQGRISNAMLNHQPVIINNIVWESYLYWKEDVEICSCERMFHEFDEACALCLAFTQHFEVLHRGEKREGRGRVTGSGREGEKKGEVGFGYQKHNLI